MTILIQFHSNENVYSQSFNCKSFNNNIDTFISFQLHPSRLFFYKTSMLFKCGCANIIRAQNVIFKNVVIQNIFKKMSFVVIKNAVVQDVVLKKFIETEIL